MTLKNWEPPTSLEIQEIIEKNDISIKKAAHMARIGERTFRDWLKPDDPKLPSQAAWSVFLYELKARQLGYKNLDHVFVVIEEINNDRV